MGGREEARTDRTGCLFVHSFQESVSQRRRLAMETAALTSTLGAGIPSTGKKVIDSTQAAMNSPSRALTPRAILILVIQLLREHRLGSLILQDDDCNRTVTGYAKRTRKTVNSSKSLFLYCKPFPFFLKTIHSCKYRFFL